MFDKQRAFAGALALACVLSMLQPPTLRIAPFILLRQDNKHGARLSAGRRKRCLWAIGDAAFRSIHSGDSSDCPAAHARRWKRHSR